MSRRSSTWFWIVMAATLWAAFSRLYHLASLPPQAWVDEAWYNLRARDLLLTGHFQVFYPTFWGGMHPLVVDLTAIVQALGIHSLVASRALSAASGIVTVPLAFATFDELWRREAWSAWRRRMTAAITALILSNLLYMVVASRIGYGPALIPPAMLVYVWQTRRAQRTGDWTGWAVAGLALGLAQYVNLNGRFLIPLVVVLALHDLWMSRSGQRRSVFLGLCLTAGVSVLTALPLIVFFIREPQWLLARADHVTVGVRQDRLSQLLNNALRIALSFNLVGDFNPRQDLPYRPMLDVLQSIGLWAGLVWAARNVRRSPAARELPAWMGLMSLSSLVTDDAPQFERMIGVGAPAAALVAMGWMEIWSWVNRQEERRPHPGQARPTAVTTALAGLLVVVSVGFNTYDYFVRYPQVNGLAESFTATPVQVAHAMIERSLTGPVFVERITEAEDVYAFDFLFPGTSVRRLDFRQCLPLTDGRATPTTYLVLAERDEQTTPNLIRAYPNALATHAQPESASLMGEYSIVEVPAGTPAPPPAHPANARFGPGITLLGYEWSGAEVKPGESVFLTLHWKAEKDFDDDLTAFAHVVAGSGGTRLIAQHDGQPCQGLYPTSRWRSGDVIPDSFAVTIPQGTPAGDYPLAVGWYQYPSIERLTLVSADNPLTDNRAVIASVTVLNRER